MEALCSFPTQNHHVEEKIRGGSKTGVEHAQTSFVGVDMCNEECIVGG